MRINFLIIILFFSIISLKSQQVEISAIGYSIISGFTQYNQIKDRHYFAIGNPVYKGYSKNWHKLQTLETISLINVGIQIEIANESYLPGIITDVFLTGAIRWIITDATYQLLLGNSFFASTLYYLQNFGYVLPDQNLIHIQQF